MSPIKNFATVFGFAAASALGTLAFAVPGTTFADPVVQVTNEGTKIDNVLLNGKLEKDAKSKTGWTLVVTAENKSDKAETVALVADVTRTVAQPMGRVMPMPVSVWQDKETVALGAHEKITKRVEVNAALAKSMNDAAANEAKLTGPQAQFAARTYFNVRFQNPTV